MPSDPHEAFLLGLQPALAAPDQRPSALAALVAHFTPVPPASLDAAFARWFLQDFFPPVFAASLADLPPDAFRPVGEILLRIALSFPASIAPPTLPAVAHCLRDDTLRADFLSPFVAALRRLPLPRQTALIAHFPDVTTDVTLALFAFHTTLTFDPCDHLITDALRSRPLPTLLALLPSLQTPAGVHIARRIAAASGLPDDPPPSVAAARPEILRHLRTLSVTSQAALDLCAMLGDDIADLVERDLTPDAVASGPPLRFVCAFASRPYGVLLRRCAECAQGGGPAQPRAFAWYFRCVTDAWRTRCSGGFLCGC